MNQLSKTLAIINSIVFILTFSRFKLGIMNLYYALNILTLGVLLVVSYKMKFNRILLIFILSGFASLLFNKIPTLFQAPQRFLAFILISTLIGPLIKTKPLIVYRYYLFSYLIPIINATVLFSFLAYVLKLPLVEGRGGITGLFTHSMILGPMSSISAFHNLFLYFKHNSKKHKLFFLFATIISILTGLLAGSRISLAGTAVGVIFILYKVNGNSFAKFTKTFLLIICITILSFPYWKTYTETVVIKTQYSQDQSGSVTFSRQSLWETRLLEFSSSPLYGIGFATVDLDLNYRFSTESGVIEPGSSWLAILSMLGLWGFIPLVIFVLYHFWFFFKLRFNLLNSALLGAIVLFFMVHMIAEGYIIAAGGAMFYIFWLSIGNASQFLNICKKVV